MNGQFAVVWSLTGVVSGVVGANLPKANSYHFITFTSLHFTELLAQLLFLFLLHDRSRLNGDHKTLEGSSRIAL